MEKIGGHVAWIVLGFLVHVGMTQMQNVTFRLNITVTSITAAQRQEDMKNHGVTTLVVMANGIIAQHVKEIVKIHPRIIGHTQLGPLVRLE